MSFMLHQIVDYFDLEGVQFSYFTISYNCHGKAETVQQSAVYTLFIFLSPKSNNEKVMSPE